MQMDKTFNLAWENPDSKYPKEYYAHCEKFYQVAKYHKVTDFPINLTIENSTRCNLKCHMCMRKQLRLPSLDMEFRHWIRLLDEAKEYPDFHSLKPNLRNEPTMNLDLWKMLYYGKECHAKEIIMNTNGNYRYMLNDLMSPYLTEIAFSVDAYYPETYRKVRPGGNLDTVEINIKKMVALKERHKDLRVRVAYVIQEDNAGREVDRFLNHYKKIGVDKIVINHCYNPGQKGSERGIVQWKQRKDFICPQIYQRLVVTATGEVLPCCASYDESLSLGNIFKDKDRTLYDYWHSPAMQNIREIHEAGMYKDIPTCANCALTYEPVVRNKNAKNGN